MSFSYISSKNIVHSYEIDNFQDGSNFLYDSGSDVDGISYDTKNKIKILMLDIDEKKNYFIKYDCWGSSDAIDNITFSSTFGNTEMLYVIDGVEYTDIKEFLYVVSEDHKFNLKFIFKERPKYGNEIDIYYRNYLFKPKVRQYLKRFKI